MLSGTKIMKKIAILCAAILVGFIILKLTPTSRNNPEPKNMTPPTATLKEPIGQTSAAQKQTILNEPKPFKPPQTNPEPNSKNTLQETQEKIAQIRFTLITPQQLATTLQKLGFETSFEKKGNKSIGERFVINGSHPDIGIKFFQSSFNKTNNGEYEISFARYIVDPENSDQSEIETTLSQAHNANHENENNRSLWRLTNGMQLVVIPDHKEPLKQVSGTLVSYEFEIH